MSIHLFDIWKTRTSKKKDLESKNKANLLNVARARPVVGSPIAIPEPKKRESIIPKTCLLFILAASLPNAISASMLKE